MTYVAGMPRPPLPDDEKRKIRPVWMTDDEWEKVASAAALIGISAGEVMRRGGLKEAANIRRRKRYRGH